METVSHKDWCEALDELTTYLKKRLKGRTKWGAHSERVLETPALDYYTEEAVAKLIEGYWKWQDCYTLGEQLIEIAGSLITKNAEKYAREHPWVAAHTENTESTENHALGGYFKPEPKFIEVMDPDDLPDCIDPSTGSGTEDEALDETYEMVMKLVSDDEELIVYVEAIRHCGNFSDLPEYLGFEKKKVYRLQEKLMRRIRATRKRGEL